MTPVSKLCWRDMLFVRVRYFGPGMRVGLCPVCERRFGYHRTRNALGQAAGIRGAIWKHIKQEHPERVLTRDRKRSNQS